MTRIERIYADNKSTVTIESAEISRIREDLRAIVCL